MVTIKVTKQNADNVAIFGQPFYEKMTDVNIATQIIIDAYQDKYDIAMLLSGDSDLVPPIKAVHEHFKHKRIFVAFPPKRHNSSVALVAKGSMMTGRKKLVDSLFDDEVRKQDGFILKKPKEWIQLLTKKKTKITGYNTQGFIRYAAPGIKPRLN